MIAQINPETATLLTSEGEKEEKNPLEQARDYALAVKHLLERDRLLVQIEGRYKGKLAFPVNYGVVFTNITRNQFEAEVSGQIGVLIAASDTARINLRSEPSSDVPTCRYGLVGDRIIVQDSSVDSNGNTWYKVEFQESKAVGWIRGDFVGF